jgi:cyclophilin family peptidyl-prolyl cis-trans isomerase
MKKTYLVAAALFVVIVGGAFVWKSVSKNSVPEQVSEVTPTNTPVQTQPVTPIPTQTATPTVSMTKTYSNPPAMTIDPNKTYTATMVTDKGTMAVRLFSRDTPVTVNNFVFLARAGFYANTIFHRVIKGFMIQGGDPLGTGTGGPGYSFPDEKITRDYTRGTIAMANSGPNTNGSQFFIMHATYPLPKQYVIFGAIDPNDAASLATLDAIATQSVTDNGTGEDSKPVTPTVLQSISIKEK